MRLESLEIVDTPPVKKFSVADLADVIVLAGPNGVGKTRLTQALFNAFRQPQSHPGIRLTVRATCESERNDWHRDLVDTRDAAQGQLLAKTIQKNRLRTRWESSVFQFESDRGHIQYNPYSFSWDAGDPWREQVGWDHSLGGLRSRYQDTISSLFRKVHSRNNAIATKGLELIRAGGGHIDPAEFPDPIAPFKEAFRQLLAPKELVDPDPRDQTLYFTYLNNRFPLNALSSGEREVVNVAFDFLLRHPTDSIIVFDEPELHLHPELTYKLLHTLRNSGLRNQFVFATHSPDIITASLEHSVVFVSPPKDETTNQAIVVREDDATNEALRLIGQSIGIVSLGRRIVLIEGSNTSLDKQAYGAILKNRFPNLVLVPSGGKGLIQSFDAVVTNVLSKSIWGVEFYMLCDRDALPMTKAAEALQERATGRLKVLNRYHLENYLLDEEVLAKLFVEWEAEESWLRNPGAIRERLESIAKATIPYATALTVAGQCRERFGNLDLMVKGCHGKSASDLSDLIVGRSREEASRFTSVLDEKSIARTVRDVYECLNQSLKDGTWKSLIPGKPVFDQFASAANTQSGRLKTRFLAEADRMAEHPFQEIIDIFHSFSIV